MLQFFDNKYTYNTTFLIYRLANRSIVHWNCKHQISPNRAALHLTQFIINFSKDNDMDILLTHVL